MKSSRLRDGGNRIGSRGGYESLCREEREEEFECKRTWRQTLFFFFFFLQCRKDRDAENLVNGWHSVRGTTILQNPYLVMYLVKSSPWHVLLMNNRY